MFVIFLPHKFHLFLFVLNIPFTLIYLLSGVDNLFDNIKC